MHYYKFNIADYRKDTGHLNTIEHGIYRQLIDWYYLDEKPIPHETQVVIRRLRLGSDEQKYLEIILKEFFKNTSKGYVHPRIEIDIHGYQENSDKNRTNGKLGGRPKKTQSVISGLLNESESKGNHKPLTINHKPLTNNHKPNNINTAPEGVSQETWESFLAQRKLSRAAVTETVIKAIQRECDKAGWSLEQALTEIVSRGWRSFKAEWILDKPKASNKSFYQTDLEIKQKRHDELVGKTRSQLIDITPENFLEMK